MNKLFLICIAALLLNGCAVKKNPKYTTEYCENLSNIMFDKSKGGNVEMFKEWSYNCVDYSKIGHGPRKFPTYYRVKVYDPKGVRTRTVKVQRY